MLSEWKDRIKKQVEQIRGLYQYPGHMLGRNLESKPLRGTTDILVIAAHPDDDVLGLAVILHRHRIAGETVTVVFTTNGTGQSWKNTSSSANRIADIRYQEAVEALSLIGVPEENVIALGFPDQGTQRYLKEMSEDITELIHHLQPKRLYVHSIEGGHTDHDITSYLVQSVCNRVHYSHVYEWAEYNHIFALGSPDIDFPADHADPGTGKERVQMSEEERLLKEKMLMCHRSQDIPNDTVQGEIIRQASYKRNDLEAKLFLYCQMSRGYLKKIVQSVQSTILTFDIVGVMQIYC